MNEVTFASVGGVLIGLAASSVVYWQIARRVAGTSEWANAQGWLMSFGLSICTFFGVLPFLVGNGEWLLIIPLLNTGLALSALHRAGEAAEKSRMKPVELKR